MYFTQGLHRSVQQNPDRVARPAGGSREFEAKPAERLLREECGA